MHQWAQYTYHLGPLITPLICMRDMIVMKVYGLYRIICSTLLLSVDFLLWNLGMGPPACLQLCLQ